jgi:hypothetical protein
MSPLQAQQFGVTSGELSLCSVTIRLNMVAANVENPPPAAAFVFWSAATITLEFCGTGNVLTSLA